MAFLFIKLILFAISSFAQIGKISSDHSNTCDVIKIRCCLIFPPNRYSFIALRLRGMTNSKSL
jgi:hypothetical protein